MRAVALLPALTGNVGVAGGGWQYANLASHVLQDPPLPPEPRRHPRSNPGVAAGPGARGARSPARRRAWIEKGNPASQNPRSRSSSATRSRRLDLVVVVDQFLTDTTALAHYVLPAKTMFEEEDLVHGVLASVPAAAREGLRSAGRGEDRDGDLAAAVRALRLRHELLPAPTRETRCCERCCRATAPALLDALRERAGRSVRARRRRVRGPPLPDAVRQGRVRVGARPRGCGASIPVPDYAPLDEGHDSPLRGTVPAAAALVQDARPDPLAVRQSRLGARRRAAAPARHPPGAMRAARGLARRATRPSCGTTAAGSRLAVRLDHGHPPGRRARPRRPVPRGRPGRQRAHRRGRHGHEPRRDVLRVPRGGGARMNGAGLPPRPAPLRRLRRVRARVPARERLGLGRPRGDACCRSTCAGTRAVRPTSCRWPATTATSRPASRPARRARTRSAPTASSCTTRRGASGAATARWRARSARRDSIAASGSSRSATSAGDGVDAGRAPRLRRRLSDRGASDAPEEAASRRPRRWSPALSIRPAAARRSDFETPRATGGLLCCRRVEQCASPRMPAGRAAEG